MMVGRTVQVRMFTVKHGRDKRGRFAKRNRYGRKPGTPNQTTVDVRALRERIVQSWDRCDGEALLERIAKTDPLAYVRLIVTLLPHDERPTVTDSMRIIVNTKLQLMFGERVMQLAGDGRVKPATILQALESMPDDIEAADDDDRAVLPERRGEDTESRV